MMEQRQRGPGLAALGRTMARPDEMMSPKGASPESAMKGRLSDSRNDRNDRAPGSRESKGGAGIHDSLTELLASLHDSHPASASPSGAVRRLSDHKNDRANDNKGAPRGGAVDDGLNELLASLHDSRPASYGGSMAPVAVLQAALLPSSEPPSRGRGTSRPRDGKPPRLSGSPQGGRVTPQHRDDAAPEAMAASPASSPTEKRPPPLSSPSEKAVPSPWGKVPSGKTAFISLASDENAAFRPYMEDGQQVLQPLLRTGRDKEEIWDFFGVYDGHGGRSELDYVEEKLHTTLTVELRSRKPQEALVQTFKKVDGQLAMMGAWNSGCTATVVLVHQCGQQGVRSVHVANVGDSRAVLVSPSGDSRRVSIDHRANDADEAARVCREGGFVRHGRVAGQLSVSRSLGDHHLKDSGVSCVPDVSSFNARDGHALIVASDGLWDAFSDDDAGEALLSCVKQAQQSGQAVADFLRENTAKILVQSAKDRGSRDNILAMVLFF